MYIFINLDLLDNNPNCDEVNPLWDADELAIIANSGYHIIDDQEDLDLFRQEKGFCPLELCSSSNNQLAGSYLLLKRVLCNIKFQNEIDIAV